MSTIKAILDHSCRCEHVIVIPYY